MNSDRIEKIKTTIDQNFEEGGYRLREAHFENGRNLHSDQYYFAKSYFQNTNNCNEMAALLASKLVELGFDDSTTLIGCQDYTGLVLNKTIKMVGRYNYAIVEQEGDSFIWQHLPALRKNLVIILPITCTCSTYIKLRKFLIDDLKNNPHYQDFDIKISNDFINVFLILEDSLRTTTESNIRLKELKDSPKENDQKLYKLYSAFNWTEINGRQILFHSNSNTVFTANPLIRLYSKMYLPESCPYCFPNSTEVYNEKPVFPTYDNFESPNLIFGFHNFKKVSEEKNFFKTFSSKEVDRSTLLSGHISVNKSSFSSYVRGNEFYRKNREDILKFFDRKLSENLSPRDENIVFITAGHEHNSNFLDDIALSSTLKKRSVTILRFEPSKEFVDNFISLYSNTIKNEAIKVIYFEEVLSAGFTLKLVSDYIKHARILEPKLTGRHGIDLVLTLVDRTPSYNRDEILKKIYSRRNPTPNKKFIAYFTLNVPIISAYHLGNHLQRKTEELKKMMEQCHLDSLKMTVSSEISKHQPKHLPEIDIKTHHKRDLRYFVFGDIERNIDEDLFELYKNFNEERLNLLKLKLAHEINSELAKSEYQAPQFFDRYKPAPDRFIDELFEKIYASIRDELSDYFLSPDKVNSPSRQIAVEREIVQDAIVKILSRPPFTYQRNIFEPIFYYCVRELDKLYRQIEADGIRSFAVFRKLKFYLRRSIDLNSNYIVSYRFIKCVKDQYTKFNYKKVIDYHGAALNKIRERRANLEISEEYYEAATNNINYKLKQISTFMPRLHFYYKELVFRNPSISIKLEELLNSEPLLAKGKNDPANPNYRLEDFITDPYFYLIGMVKAENINFLNALKDFHKKIIERQLESSAIEKTQDFFKYRNVRNHYLKEPKNDPIILSARKLLEKSRHRESSNYEHIETALINMLLTVGLLEQKKNDAGKSRGNALNDEIKEILDSALNIIQPGIAKEKLAYVFFVKFSKAYGGRDATENIYTLSSRESPKNLNIIKLHQGGLIYNLIQGLFSDGDAKTEQSLIAGAKLEDGRVVSFSDKFFVTDKDSIKEATREIDFTDLYKNDLLDNVTQKGIEPLSSANMFLGLRFANLIKKREKDNYSLEGKAALLIINEEQSTLPNFINFMSDEKVRLLLLIKEELMHYLQKQLDNDAFIEVLENKKSLLYKDRLGHGLKDYLSSLEYFFSESFDDNDDFGLFGILINAMRGQIDAVRIGNEIPKPFTRDEVLKIIRLIFKSTLPGLGDREIDFEEINLENLNFKTIEINSKILHVVLPELLINMKKYCPRIGDRNLSIGFDSETRTFSLTNNILKTKYRKTPEGQKRVVTGLAMCKGIMEKLGGSVIETEQKGVCTVYLRLPA